MPDRVKVGAHVYSIVRGAFKDHGGCDFNTLTITVRLRLRKSKAQEILLHEILHACTYPTMASVQGKTDEEIVDAIAPTLLQVLRENPLLVEYLAGTSA